MSPIYPKSRQHAFSIYLKSKEYLKRLSIPNESSDEVLIEGFIGELHTASLVEGAMLEIEGTNGSLRMDLNEDELLTLLKKKTRDE